MVPKNLAPDRGQAMLQRARNAQNEQVEVTVAQPGFRPFHWFKMGAALGLMIGVASMIGFRWTFAYGCFSIKGLLLIGYLNYRLRGRCHPQHASYWLTIGLMIGYACGAV